VNRSILTLTEKDAAAATDSGLFSEVFLWDKAKSTTTILSSIGPYLLELGVVNPRNIDLVRIALGVLAADRSVLRQARGSNWNARNFELTTPVESPSAWKPYAQDLSQIVDFLTGDYWNFRFTQAPPASETILGLEERQHSRAVLLSGGADSASGALISAHQLSPGQSQELVSHFSQKAISPVQKAIVATLNETIPGITSVHRQFRLQRAATRLDGTDFPNEFSSRSRSLLFLALGLAVASQSSVPLWIPENGFASLNPPLGPDRRGSLSTRTTHPLFLRRLTTLLESVGGHGEIMNPFESMTKGEMFRQVANAVGDDAASIYLSATNSCSHTDARFIGASSTSSCGVCFGCLVRRAAFISSGIPDRTQYLLHDKSGKSDDFIEQKTILEPLRDFVARGIRSRDIMAMPLPGDYSPREALSICERGVEELEVLF
jgi:hypothetical protein